MDEIFKADLPTQLALLRQTTKLTGGLHEAQVQQLKVWPLLTFQWAEQASFTWDPDKREVYFHPQPPKWVRPKRDHLQKGADVLATWVCGLLGDEWETVVILGDDRVVGKRNGDVRRDPDSRRETQPPDVQGE